MAKKMINELSDKLEKLTVVEQSLQEDTQCIVDILSRFLFESKVFAKDIAQPLSENDMSLLFEIKSSIKKYMDKQAETENK
jgi:hypothetical protein